MSLYRLVSTSPLPSIDQVGGKARSLIACAQAGFDVPDGLVLPVGFLQPWLDHLQGCAEWNAMAKDPSSLTKQDCEALQQHCQSLTLSVEQWQVLEQGLHDVFATNGNRVIVAVRSSSPDEDLAKTSFAGGYETTLGVVLQEDGLALVEALRHSFASMLDYRVVQYKLQHGLVDSVIAPRLAILVQRQIASEVSGVAFSVNPHNNCFDEAVIASNVGLGESVVNGVVTPDTYIVDKVTQTILEQRISDNKSLVYRLDTAQGGVIQETVEDCTMSSLTKSQILEVAALVVAVEQHYQQPMDIEWAYEGSKLYLLQARPITTYLPLYSELLTQPGEPKMLYMDLIAVSQGFDSPMSTLGLEIWGYLFRLAKRHMVPGPTGHIWELHGRQYINLSNVMGSPGGKGMTIKAFAAAMGGQLQRLAEVGGLDEYVAPSVVPENRRLVWVMIADMFKMVPSMLYGLWNPTKAMKKYLDCCDELFENYRVGGPREQAGASGMTFRQETEAAIGAFNDAVLNAGGLLMGMYSKYRVDKMFEGDDEVEPLLLTLLMDLVGNPTSEMGHAMFNLASSPEFKETATSDEFLRKLNEKCFSDDFLSTYNDFMAKFGCRGMKEIDIATPRTYEDQAALFDRIKLINTEDNQILTVKKRKEEAYETLLEHARRKRKEDKFRYHAGYIQRMGGYREHPKYMYVFLVAYLRRRALAIGKTFVEQGRLDQPEDIFNLSLDQVSEAEGNASLELRSLVRRNKEPIDAVAHVTSWPVLVDSRGKIVRVPPKPVEGAMTGDPISPGTVRGRAKVLQTPYEKPLDSGEILVARATEPSWTPIFTNAVGVVLEVGGPLQHGAIIAREYGIPCVSDIEAATRVIHDGDLLEVDGTNGTVRVIHDNDEEEARNGASLLA